MLLSKLVVALSALASAGAPEPAAPFKPVQDFAPQAVSFDDRPGKGFEWDKRLPCGANRATVTVKFDKAYVGGLQAPVAKVWLHSEQPGEGSEQWIAAVLRAPTDIWKLNALAWLEKVTGSKSVTPGGYAPADLTHPLRVDFAWTRDGVVSVNFGGELVKQLKMDKPITGVGVGGSFAKFEFIDLKVGRAGTPDPACERPNVAQISSPTSTR